MLQEIQVTIAPDGTTKVFVQGVNGPQCLSITKNMESLLGDTVLDRTHTDEYHEAPLTDAQWATERSD